MGEVTIRAGPAYEYNDIFVALGLFDTTTMLETPF